uniref:CABIT domain-containing protein n=1 Tax=Phlebotomus papatasi TaxID=29031 RepID=A0A1B0D5L5_PHLPP
MAGSIRLSDIQNSNLDFERKQHLANWLIKSSPHMPNPIATITTTGIPSHHHTTVKSPIYFWGQPGHMSLTSSKSPIFTSQTNLPLQIITTQDGQKPKLRRFNSHDTSANMFSVADFENSRLATKRQNPSAVKSNSLGGDASTEDSENSKFGSDSSKDVMPIERFLHRNFLPKVARLITSESNNENTLDIYEVKNSEQNLSKLQSLQDLSRLDSILNKPAHKTGELMLIYKQIRNRKLYHAISTKSMDSKKGIKIPQEYPGYFSLLNEKGGTTASIYTTIIQLVRERVYKFLSMENMIAYSESPNQDIAIKSHYVKTTAKAGQVFRLLAVFEDGRSQHQNKSGPLSDFSSSSDREKVRGRYAQLLCENRQMLYVSLATKGKFYEVEMNSQSHSRSRQQQKTGTANPEFVHRISDIMQSAPLPLNIKLISGTLPGISTDCITIHKVSMEDVLISCFIDERESRSSLALRTVTILPDMKLQKCLLGYENEKKLLASPNIQNILKYCKFNYENHTQTIELEHLAEQPIGKMRKIKNEGFKLLRPIKLTKLLHREKSYVAHEKEDSIIFLTKAELQRLETEQQQQQQKQTKPPERSMSSKMKVFEPSKRKWFAERKNAKNKTSSFSSFDISLEGSRQIARYSDMSKMIQDRFGSECDIASSQFGRESRALSDIGYDIRCSVPRIDKTMSLENMKLHSSATMLATTVISPTPDLVKVDKSNIVGSADRLSQQEISSVSPGKSQQSFISKKLYSEFHVKTKQNSKSSSNLHQLWHQLGLPQKSSKNHKSKESKSTADKEMHRSNFKVADEYSNVQDSIVSLDDNASSIYDSKICMENIYAEICVHNVAPDERHDHSQTDNTNL